MGYCDKKLYKPVFVFIQSEPGIIITSYVNPLTNIVYTYFNKLMGSLLKVFVRISWSLLPYHFDILGTINLLFLVHIGILNIGNL